MLDQQDELAGRVVVAMNRQGVESRRNPVTCDVGCPELLDPFRVQMAGSRCGEVALGK